MSELESGAVTPEELIRELEEAVRQRRENKYAFQVALKDLEFEVDEDEAKALELSLPFQNVDQAEQALREGVVRPTLFLENDGAEHWVVVFDHKPVGFSGFMDYVADSLALTDQGLFEVGGYGERSGTIIGSVWLEATPHSTGAVGYCTVRTYAGREW